jgi:hypothetical protein
MMMISQRLELKSGATTRKYHYAYGARRLQIYFRRLGRSVQSLGSYYLHDSRHFGRSSPYTALSSSS